MSTSLNDIQRLGVALINAESDVEMAERALKDAKERVRVLREETLPMAMIEIGIDEYKLNSGEKLSIKQDVASELTKEQKPAAFDWLEKNGYGGLIKTHVVTEFGKGKLAEAVELLQRLREERHLVLLNRDVHYQTMMAFLREQCLDAEKAKAFPFDLFGARPIWTTRVVVPKEKK